MTRRKVTLAGASVLVLLLVTTGCGGGEAQEPPPSQSPDIAAGHQLFKATCSMCHGPNGGGRAMLGKDLRNNQWVRDHSDEELVQFLAVGRSRNHPLNERGVDMPPRGGNLALTDEDLALIVAYMKSLN